MKSVFIIAIAIITIVLAGPLDHREYKTVTNIVATVTQYVSFDGSKTHKVSSIKHSLSASSTSTGQSCSATRMTSQAPSTNQETTSSKPWSSSSTSAVSSSQASQSAFCQSNDTQMDDSWKGDKPCSMSYAKPIIDAHNSHRLNHTVSQLTWSSRLEGIAKQIADTCYYSHSMNVGGGGYGQNIGAGYRAFEVAALITNTMYNGEIENYPGAEGQEPDLANHHLWGHYTQIVWKDTQEVGCWTTDCSAPGLGNAPGIGPAFTVCNYFPTGNFIGEFGAQIRKPSGMATITIPKEPWLYSFPKSKSAI